MKAIGDGLILKSKTVTAVECLHQPTHKSGVKQNARKGFLGPSLLVNRQFLGTV